MARGVWGSTAVCVGLSLAVLGAGCALSFTSNQVTGTGEVRTESRSVAEFTRIEARNGIRLEVTIGSPASVSVTAQENLLPIVTTAVASGRLTVQTTQGYVSTRGITVNVSLPGLDELSLTGGVVANATGVSGSALLIAAEGGAVVTATGSVDAMTLNASGGTVLNLAGLTARTASVDLSGGVTGTFAATDSVTGSASGGVIVAIQGHPASVNVATSGGAIISTP